MKAHIAFSSEDSCRNSCQTIYQSSCQSDHQSNYHNDCHSHYQANCQVGHQLNLPPDYFLDAGASGSNKKRCILPPEELRILELRLEEFRRHLSAQNMSENTVHVYAYAVRQFFQLYREINYSNLHLYKVYLLEHYKPQTVNLRIRSLNSYIEFKRIDAGKLPMVRIQQKNYLDNVISEADYEYLKNCLVRDEKFLYYFIIRFMAATGARVSEVIQFEAEDVFRGCKDIYSKGNKVRRIYVPKALQRDTQMWLKSINHLHGYIFLNRFGDPISPAGIRGQLKTMAAAYGMNPEVVYPHSFRHRFAKSFIEKCGDIALLSDLLGHKNLETTRIYLRRSSSEQYEIVNKVVDW